MKKLSERLFDRLNDLGFELKEIPVRHATSFNLRECGAWRWSAMMNSGRIGSCYTMKQCLNAKKLRSHEIHHIDIDVSPE